MTDTPDSWNYTTTETKKTRNKAILVGLISWKRIHWADEAILIKNVIMSSPKIIAKWTMVTSSHISQSTHDKSTIDGMCSIGVSNVGRQIF